MEAVNGICLITGADFLDPAGRRWIHGDLHQLLNILIFNAAGCKWIDGEETPLDSESLAVYSTVFFERNNTIVFPIELAVFNNNAHEFLVKDLNKTESRIITLDSKLSH